MIRDGEQASRPSTILLDRYGPFLMTVRTIDDTNSGEWLLRPPERDSSGRQIGDGAGCGGPDQGLDVEICAREVRKTTQPQSAIHLRWLGC
jgi:hypothetical protein